MVKLRWESDFKETIFGEIPKDWDEKLIKEIGDVGGGSTPLTKVKEYWDGAIAWITPDDLAEHKFRYISHGKRNITEKAVKEHSLRIYPSGTVLLTSRAPIGYVAIAKNSVTTNQGFKNIVPNGKTNSEFLYYLLKNIVEYLRDIAGGSTFSELTATTLREIKVPFPDSKEQSRIAIILSYFDSLIENKIRQNEVLEKVAMAIFKSWFVDFEPFKDGEFEPSELGEIPKGWRIRKVREIFIPLKGKNCSLSEKFIEGYKPYLGVETYKTGIKKYWTKENEPFVDELDVVLIADGEGSGKVFRHQKGILGSTLLTLKPKVDDKSLQHLIYLWLKSMESELMYHRTGTYIQHLDKNYLLGLDIIVPSDSDLNKFHSIVDPLFQKIILNQKQILVLKKVRDLLLPLLVFGKLRVEEL